MGVEIERKFLVHLHLLDREMLRDAKVETITQGYVSRGSESQANVRVRLTESEGSSGTLTLKSPLLVGSLNSRKEWNLPMSEQDARDLLSTIPEEERITKMRYIFPYGDGLSWELDVFTGRNAGLVLAEIEIPREDYPLSLPSWIREEAPDIVNSKLADHPWYALWSPDRVLGGKGTDVLPYLQALFGEGLRTMLSGILSRTATPP